MHHDQLQGVLTKYDDLLANTYPSIPAQRHQDGPFTDVAGQLAHARWMCHEALGFMALHVRESRRDPAVGLVVSKQVEKAMRWLGFIQGVFWATGFRAIDEMKDDNRSEPASA